MNSGPANQPTLRIAAGAFTMAAALSSGLTAAAQQKAPGTPHVPETVVPRARTLAGNDTAREQADQLMRMSRGGIVDKDLVFACVNALEAAAWGDAQGAASYHALAELLSREERDRCRAEARDDLAGSDDVVRLRMLQSPRTLP